MPAALWMLVNSVLSAFAISVSSSCAKNKSCTRVYSTVVRGTPEGASNSASVSMPTLRCAVHMAAIRIRNRSNPWPEVANPRPICFMSACTSGCW